MIVSYVLKIDTAYQFGVNINNRNIRKIIEIYLYFTILELIEISIYLEKNIKNFIKNIKI